MQITETFFKIFNILIYQEIQIKLLSDFILPQSELLNSRIQKKTDAGIDKQKGNTLSMMMTVKIDESTTEIRVQDSQRT